MTAPLLSVTIPEMLPVTLAPAVGKEDKQKIAISNHSLAVACRVGLKERRSRPIRTVKPVNLSRMELP
jgi:hypothetical protein